MGRRAKESWKLVDPLVSVRYSYLANDQEVEDRHTYSVVVRHKLERDRDRTVFSVMTPGEAEQFALELIDAARRAKFNEEAGRLARKDSHGN